MIKEVSNELIIFTSFFKNNQFRTRHSRIIMYVLDFVRFNVKVVWNLKCEKSDLF